MNASTQKLPTYQYNLYASLSTLEFLVGTPLNLLCLIYFISKSKVSNSRFSHISISTVDVIQCSLSIFPALTCYFKGAEILFGSAFLCSIYGIIWNITPRLSVFLIAVLNISRTVALIYPLRNIRRRYVMIPIAIYATIQMLQASLPYWFGAFYTFNPYYIGCGWNLSDIPLSWNAFKLLYVFLVPVQYILPSIPILLSCGISCTQLWITNSRLTRKPGSNAMLGMVRRKTKATVTIIVLTAVYAASNIPYCFVIVCHTLRMFSVYDVFQHLTYEERDLLNNLTFTHTVTFNSMANSLIYFTRIENIRTFGSKVLSGASRIISRREKLPEEANPVRRPHTQLMSLTSMRKMSQIRTDLQRPSLAAINLTQFIKPPI